jgi:hypothetical protein
MTGAVSANLCNNVKGFYEDFDNKNGANWLRFCQSPTCPKFIFEIHTNVSTNLARWPFVEWRQYEYVHVLFCKN